MTCIYFLSFCCSNIVFSFMTFKAFHAHFCLCLIGSGISSSIAFSQVFAQYLLLVFSDSQYLT